MLVASALLGSVIGYTLTFVMLVKYHCRMAWGRNYHAAESSTSTPDYLLTCTMISIESAPVDTMEARDAAAPAESRR